MENSIPNGRIKYRYLVSQMLNTFTSFKEKETMQRISDLIWERLH